MIDLLTDAFLDTVKIVPFLFITYTVLEWMEHETGKKFEHFLENHRKIAPLAGSVFGLIPECGFCSAASSLYTTGVVSAGTLAAVYLASSDEMLPVMISSQAGMDKIGPILIVKLIVAVLAGYLADYYSKHTAIDVEEFCEREHCDCSHGILISALKHTLTITIWLFVIGLLLNTAIECIGMDTLRIFLLKYPKASIFLCTLTGLIPNCASSVLLTQLYLENLLSFPAVCAGLLVNSGIGMLVLFRVNPNTKDNLKIVGYVTAVSLITGCILNLFI